MAVAPGRRSAVLAAVAVWALVGGVLFVVFWLADTHQRRVIEGLNPSVETAGTVVSLDTRNHDSMEYAYTDNRGQRRQGGDQGDGQEQGDPANLKVGDEITIWYNPNHPQTSCYCTPGRTKRSELYQNEILISQFLAIPAGVVTGLATARRDRRRVPA